MGEQPNGENLIQNKEGDLSERSEFSPSLD